MYTTSQIDVFEINSLWVSIKNPEDVVRVSLVKNFLIFYEYMHNTKSGVEDFAVFQNKFTKKSVDTSKKHC
jgi:hypothetical protein